MLLVDEIIFVINIIPTFWEMLQLISSKLPEFLPKSWKNLDWNQVFFVDLLCMFVIALFPLTCFNFVLLWVTDFSGPDLLISW